MHFLRALFMRAVILSIVATTSVGAQSVLTGGVSGVQDIPHTLHVKDPEDVVVPKGHNATLRCPVGGSFSAVNEIIWLHEDQIVPLDDPRRTVRKDGTLYIPRVTAGKRPLTGNYRCKVNSDFGVVVSGPAKLQIAHLDVDTVEEAVEVTEGQGVVLPCRFRSVPEAKIKWELDKRILTRDSRRTIFPSGNLAIFSTRPNDSGVYKCTITNGILKRSKTKTLTLKILPELKTTIESYFLPLPTNLTTPPAVKTTIFCSANGRPRPTVLWSYQGAIISNSTSLTILSPPNDTVYRCLAGNLTQDYYVKIEQKPLIVNPPKSKSYASAGTVKLDCVVSGVPEPCVEWYKDGERLKLGGRIKRKDGVLVMSHTFTYDAGVYQCVATNTAGSARASAVLVRSSPMSATPPPPQELKCRPYDDDNVCIWWRAPESLAVDAYSIYSFFRNGNESCQNGCNESEGCDEEESGPDYVTISNTFHLANRLRPNTNYTFYVRLYAKTASDDSNRVTCESSLKGERNLRFRALDVDKVELSWSVISTDVACGDSNTTYIVQWKQEDSQLVNKSLTDKLSYNVTGLNPTTTYLFRVVSSSYRNEDTNWTQLRLPQIDRRTFVIQNVPIDPEGFRAVNVGPNSVTLAWNTSNETSKFYVICVVEVEKVQRSCEEGRRVKSLNNVKKIEDLKSNTTYEFRISAHNSDGYHGFFSSTIRIRTRPNAPSAVLDLRYRVIDESSACLAWRRPRSAAEKIKAYRVIFSQDQHWPLEKWTTVTVDVNETASCWLGIDNSIERGTKSEASTILKGLKKGRTYTVLVRAVSDDGLGADTLPLQIRTSGAISHYHRIVERRGENATEDQKLGVIAGCGLASICVACCVACIIWRKRCVKRRDEAAAHAAAAAQYATHDDSVHMRLENTSLLKSDEEPRTRPKGGESQFAMANGVRKATTVPFANGGVRITENPRVENGGYRGGKSPVYRDYNDDGLTIVDEGTSAVLLRPGG